MSELTLVCENTVTVGGLIGEHGLCWHIRSQDRSLLFDTGQGFGLVNNTAKLGIPLTSLDAVVLSHGHYDHTSGLKTVLEENKSCPVYLHPGALKRKFARMPSGACKCTSISLLTDEILFASWKDRYRPVEKSTEIIPGVFATGIVPRVTTFENTGGPFFLDEALSQPDPLDDDLSLYYATSEGIRVVLGCAHAGVINILRYIHQLTGERIGSVFGGMHLLNAPEQRVKDTIAELKSLGSPALYPNHCTGMTAVHMLYNAFPGKVHTASAGMTFNG